MTLFTTNNLKKTLIVLLVLVSIFFRVISIPHTNYDMTAHNVPWYLYLDDQGIARALGTEFADYTPPYTYFLALATFTRDWIPPLTAIKIIPMCFDVLGAFLVYKIVKLKFKQGNTPALAAALYFAAPTVFLNSANWGQADSLYTAFLLICLYLVMIEKPFPSMVSLGAAFSIKAQSTFFLPFLTIMAIRRKIPWLYFSMMPLIYLIAIMPVVLLGRPFLEALLIYKDQSIAYDRLSMLSPNAYILIPNDWYSWLTPVGILGTALLLAYWVYATAKSGVEFDQKHIVLIAFLSVALTPFLLPKMHDRYFYPADVLSIVLAFYWPSLWFVPILYQFASASAISIFLFDTNPSYVVFGFLFNAIALASVLRTQRLAENRSQMSARITTPLSMLATLLVPVILFGLGFNLALTPAFVRLQYALPHTSGAQYDMDKSERFQLASTAIQYLTSDKKSQYLGRFMRSDGSPAFDGQDISSVDNIKQSVQKIFKTWHISLAAVFILGLFAWVGDWLPTFRRGARRGGWLSVAAMTALGIASILFNIFNPLDYYQSNSILTELFPKDFWQSIFLFTLLSLGAGGFLLTRISSGFENET